MDHFFNNLKNNNSDFSNTISNTNKRVWEAQQQQQGISNPDGLLNSYQHRSANGFNKKMENPDSQNFNECYAKSVPYAQQYYYNCIDKLHRETAVNRDSVNKNNNNILNNSKSHDKVPVFIYSANLPNSNLFKTNTIANKSDRENCANGMGNLCENLPNSNSFKTISPVSTYQRNFSNGHDKVPICKASQMKNIEECANLPNSNLFKTNANKSDRANCANGMRLEKNMKHLSKNLPNSNLFKTISPVSTYQRNFSNGHDKVPICKASHIKECANLPNSNLFKINANKSDRENCANGMRLEKNMKHLSKNLPNSNLFKTISPVSTYQRKFSNGHNNENHRNLNSHQNKIYSNDNHNPIGCSSVNRNSKKKQKNPKSQIKSSDGKCVACKDYLCYSDKTFWICEQCRHCLDIQKVVKLASSVGYEDPWCCPVCKEKETYFTLKTLTYTLYLY
ncbi:hypothetical protein FF38_00483 [Lucilia cuprina]|uniref:Uncharacterized protein n=1 Tax=Lucilia cuprina TaxID=7375 RepID=A0A0L0CJV6_LUCCU|nr:hypothetical protein FF38_00483 [Lucilia cuprina]